MTRLGYGSCSACHVSPSGGGILNPYGRSIANEELSTWSYDNESSLFHGAFPSRDDYLIGGDVRYLSYRRATGETHSFLMQGEIEGATTIGPLTAVLSTGIYGPTHAHESRRNYLLLKTFEGAIAYRIGHFIPTYGLALADHTALTRARIGFGEGTETYTGEISAHGRVGELFLSQSYGSQLRIVGTRANGYQYDVNQECGEIVKASLFLGERATVGASAFYGHGPHHRERMAYGTYTSYAPWTWLYELSEVDIEEQWGDGRRTINAVGMALIGLVPARGLHIEAGDGWDGKSHEFSMTVQWFPRPHWEILLKGTGATVMAMGHYYL